MSSISCNLPKPVYIYNGGIADLYLYLCCPIQNSSDVNVINGGVANIYSCYSNSTSEPPQPPQPPQPTNLGIKNKIYYSSFLILILIQLIVN
jgi:hypothetical protein